MTMKLTDKFIEYLDKKCDIQPDFRRKAIAKGLANLVKDYNKDVTTETEAYKTAYQSSYSSVEKSAAYRLIVQHNKEIKEQQEELL